MDEADYLALIADGITDARRYGKVAYYANAFDTTTQGFDIVATYPMQLAGGNTLWTFAGNYNKTEVTDINNPDAINAKRVTQLEQTLPRFRFTLTGDHRQGPGGSWAGSTCTTVLRSLRRTVEMLPVSTPVRSGSWTWKLRTP